MSHISELPKLRVVRAVSLGRPSRAAKLRERDLGAVRAVSCSRSQSCRAVFRAAQLDTPARAARELPGSELLWSRAAGAPLEFPSGPELPGRLRIGFRAAISCSNLEYSKNGYTNRNFVLFTSPLHHFIMMKCSRTSVLEHDYTHKMGRLHARKERLF